MYLPSSHYLMPIDNDPDAARPASRAEIVARRDREQRDQFTLDAVVMEADGSRSSNRKTSLVSTGIDHARRVLSRWLISAGQHIGPEAA